MANVYVNTKIARDHIASAFDEMEKALYVRQSAQAALERAQRAAHGPDIVDEHRRQENATRRVAAAEFALDKAKSEFASGMRDAFKHAVPCATWRVARGDVIGYIAPAVKRMGHNLPREGEAWTYGLVISSAVTYKPISVAQADGKVVELWKTAILQDAYRARRIGE